MNKRAKEILSVLITLAIVSNGNVIRVLASESIKNFEELNLGNKAIGVENKLNIVKPKSSKVDMNQIVNVMIEIDDKYSIEHVKNELSKVGQVTFKREFSSLVKGISVECKRSLISNLNNIEGVVSAKESEIFDRAMASADAMTKTYNVWKNYGYKGQGVVVSIIDSGIDISHKDMRVSDPSKVKIKDIKKSDETKFTLKVPYGRNFAENNDEVIDKNLFTGNHGMHVAGIVAGNGQEDDGFKGVAPEAQLLAMKVFPNNGFGSCREDDIIAAIEDSVAHGADIINMSLTTNPNFNDSNSMIQKAIKKATEKGVVVVVAAGNDAVMGGKDIGEYPVKNELNLKDISILGNPANAIDAITVASFENNIKTHPLIYLESNLGMEKFKYDIPHLSRGIGLDQIGKSLDVACLTNEQLKDVSNINLENKFVLLEYKNDDEAMLQDVMNVLQMKKIQGVILYGDLDIKNSFKYGFMQATSVIMVDKNQANKIKELADKGVKLFISSEKEIIDNVNAGSMSTFTSFGPTNDLDFKPDVTAPGGNIYSTLNDNKYATMSGTSMASPHTAGATALILEHIKSSGLDIAEKEKVNFAKNTLLNTAEIIEDKDVSIGLPYSPRRQGSGLIQIDKAIRNNVIVTGNNGVGNIALKEISYITDFDIILKNYGKQAATFELDKTPIFTEKVINEKGVFGEAVLNGGALTLDCKDISIMPGETKKIKAKLSLPVVLEKGIFVEGFIRFNSKDEKNPNLNIPYMGYFGDYGDEPIFYKVTGNKEENDKKHDNFQSTGLIYSDLKSDIETNGFISPNGDGYKDGVYPRITLLRNCRDLIIDVVDGNDGKENVLRTIGNKKDVRRLSLNSPFGAILNSSEPWDGTVYEPKYNQYVPVNDGQYYIRLRAKVKDGYSSYQTMYLPVRVDTKAPSLEVIETKVLDEEDGTKSLQVKFKSNDVGVNSSGLDLSPMSLKLTNDGKLCNLEGTPEDLGENIYNAKFKISSQEVKNFKLAIRDNAGNETVYLNDICFENLNEEGYLTAKALNEKNELELKAMVKGKVSSLMVNDKKITVGSNGKVSIILDKKQEEQKLNIKLYDKDNKEIGNLEKTVMVDTISPEIESLQFSKVKDIENTVAEYKVWGTVKHTEKNYEDIKLRINGQEVTVSKDGSFYKDMDISTIGGIEIYMSDKAGNEYTYSQLFKEDPTIKFENLDVKDILFYEPKGISKDGYLDVKGIAPEGIKQIYLNGEEVKLNSDRSFSKGIYFKTGLSKLNIRTIDKDNKKNDSMRFVMYDDTAPSVSINLDSKKDLKDTIIVDSDELIINGSVKDNTYGYKLTINGDEILNTISMMNVNLPVGDIVFRERNFEHKIKLAVKETTVNVVAEDINGNKTVKTYKVIKK